MGFHHVAVATSRFRETHCFLTEAMGFDVVKAVVNPTPEGGWARHVFYRTDDGRSGDAGLLAVWDLHGDYRVPDGGISTSLGLPEWVNHLAFTAVDEAHLDACRKRWSDLGLDVFEVDHGFCRSIYTTDPNGTMFEWCLDTRPLDEQDAAAAAAAIASEQPAFDPPPADARFHPGDPARRPDWTR